MKLILKVHENFKNNSENNVNSMKCIKLHILIYALKQKGFLFIPIISVIGKEYSKNVFNLGTGCLSKVKYGDGNAIIDRI